ncbi:MAG TPA: AAA family ATPase [Candidatus Saccharimonadales bacterium]|nr:AAA family ATPase [Candidatus Saccharimonadales bacterium]HSX27509.1 AAA family ATPase [Patescibacteria group bacterium]
MRSKLIIFNGLPATGKSTLSRQVASIVQLPLVTKDSMKESLADALGLLDKKSSKIIGSVAAESLWTLTDRFLSEGRSLMIENAFIEEYATPDLKKITSKYEPLVLEIYCVCRPDIRRKREHERIISAQRHPIHTENTLDTEEDELNKIYAPLKKGKFIEVNTTKPEQIKIVDIVSEIENL